MVRRMFIKILRFCYKKTDTITKKILKVYCFILIVLFLFVGLSVIFYKNIFYDYTTAVYWVNEFLLLGVNLTKALIIPVCFYEIMRTYFKF